MWVAISVRRVSDCRGNVRCWVLWIRCTSAMTEWRAQLLYVTDVFWHARPACCKAVVSGGMGSAIFWSLWWLLSLGVRRVGSGLAGLVGRVVGAVIGAACVGFGDFVG